LKLAEQDSRGINVRLENGGGQASGAAKENAKPDS
jgi:hypothetical protein